MSDTAPGPLQLAVAGIGVVGSAFGMARYGYGLLLPQIQSDYRLDGAALGTIGASSYAAYLVAAAVAGTWTQAMGARATVALGGALATGGMLIIALTHSSAGLEAGVLVGGASCGAVYPPFSDAVAQLRPGIRARTLSAINCGTGYGVAVAAPVAVAVGGQWREAWLLFSGCALLTTLWAVRALPGRTGSSPPELTGSSRAAGSQTPRQQLLPLGAPGLLAAGLVIGLGSAAYWTFAVDHLQRDGGISIGASRAFLGVVGVSSVLATGTGDLVDRFGARRVFAGAALSEASALVTLALRPASLPMALVSAVLFGAAYNAAVAVQAMWSARLYSRQPSLGLAIAMAANALGLLAGPVAAGAFSDAIGLTDVLLLGGVILTAAALLAPRRDILDISVRQPD
jgi:predicted MFS family arabinose efflux permease